MILSKESNPKDINKLQLEGLTKAGAFDDLESNRSCFIKFNTKYNPIKQKLVG